MAVNDRTISIRTSRLTKASKVKIIKSKGVYYIEALPSEYKENLSASELNDLYISFIKLGRELYNENKHKNISKIGIVNDRLNLDVENTLLRNAPKNYIGDEDLRNVKQRFNKMLGVKNSFNLSNHNFILLKHNNLHSSNNILKQWLLDNYTPVIEYSDEIDRETNRYWVYSDDGMLIDMAIFCYLVTYSIINAKNKFLGKDVSKDDPVTFSDFVDVDEDSNDKLYITLVNEIIYLYEMSHIYSLYGFNKMSYNYETGEYKMVRQYEDVYGVLWHMFKLYLSENYSITNNEDKHLPISICIDCGNPVLGNVMRCLDCEIGNQNVRQAKCRNEKLAHIERIEYLIHTYNFPKTIINKANKYINMNKSQRINAHKKDVDELLFKLEKYINKGSKT